MHSVLVCSAAGTSAPPPTGGPTPCTWCRSHGLSPSASLPAPLSALPQICSYAQGYNIIRAKSQEQGWGVDLAGLARIWKVGGRAWACGVV